MKGAQLFKVLCDRFSTCSPCMPPPAPHLVSRLPACGPVLCIACLLCICIYVYICVCVRVRARSCVHVCVRTCVRVSAARTLGEEVTTGGMLADVFLHQENTYTGCVVVRSESVRFCFVLFARALRLAQLRRAAGVSGGLAGCIVQIFQAKSFADIEIPTCIARACCTHVAACSRLVESNTCARW